MQILEIKKSDSLPTQYRFESNSSWMKSSRDSDLNTYGDFLHIEVNPEHKGLQVMRIGHQSPLRQLRPLGSYNMQGSVESGDRIVAIDGVLTSSTSELVRMISGRRSCEVTVYDHRTRLTVSWQLHFQEMLESTHCGTKLLAS